MAEGLIVEPIATDFDIQIPIQKQHKPSSTNYSKIKDNAGVSKAEIRSKVQHLVGDQSHLIEEVASTLCVSQSTVRRICRTLKIGPYKALTSLERKSRSSQVPFGWNFVSGALEKNPKEWRCVELMYSLRLQGKSLHQIAAHFTQLKIPTKNGGKWFAKTISQILKLNEKFLTK